MASEPVARAVAEEVARWGGMRQTGVSLRYMMEFGARPTERNLLLSAQFLHKELPIRIARRALDLDSLPFGLSHKPTVLKVRDWYLDSFRDIRYFPEVSNRDDELAFTQMIKMIRVRHTNVVPTMALGVQQLKKDLGGTKAFPSGINEIHQFLDRFYMSRIGIRMLIGQHVALHDPDPEPGVIGLINTRLSPMLVARLASEDARAICMREYGSAPDVNIYGHPDFTFPYVTIHLHLMMFELVKNSLRAVQERFMNSDKHAPPVRIIVADGAEDVTIKIHTKGRNRLEYKRLNKLAYVSYNRQMTTRFEKLREQGSKGKRANVLILEEFQWDNEWVDITAELVHQNDAMDDDNPLLWSHVDQAVGATDGLSGRHLPRRARGDFSESSPPAGSNIFYTRRTSVVVHDEDLRAELEAEDIDSDMDTNGEDNDGPTRANDIDPDFQLDIDLD